VYLKIFIKTCLKIQSIRQFIKVKNCIKMTRKSLRFVKTVPTSTFLILRIFSPLRPSAAVADAELHLSFFRMRALHLQHTAKIYEKEQLPLRTGDDSCTFSLFLSHPSHGRGCCGWPNSLSLSLSRIVFRAQAMASNGGGSSPPCKISRKGFETPPHSIRRHRHPAAPELERPVPADPVHLHVH
jgi:hypothetical protein